eukprot:5051964-Alexandrium_andersonii.AAC.1
MSIFVFCSGFLWPLGEASQEAQESPTGSCCDVASPSPQELHMCNSWGRGIEKQRRSNNPLVVPAIPGRPCGGTRGAPDNRRKWTWSAETSGPEMPQTTDETP